MRLQGRQLAVASFRMMFVAHSELYHGLQVEIQWLTDTTRVRVPRSRRTMERRRCRCNSVLSDLALLYHRRASHPTAAHQQQHIIRSDTLDYHRLIMTPQTSPAPFQTSGRYSIGTMTGFSKHTIGQNL
jgi:hypothetical protein